jgi:hypothetical protein
MRGTLLALLVTCGLVGCGAATAGETVSTGATRAEQATVATQPCGAGEYRKLGSTARAFAAAVPRRAVAYGRPGGALLARFGARNVNGAPTVFGVLGAVLTPACTARWVRVQLPMRPNGATGYVRARDVRLLRVPTRIEVDISRRRVTLFRDGKPVMRTTAAVGSPATPTPTGRYYVNQRLIPEDAGGPFGPGAIGISAFSNVLTGWTQGGPIAIHGTNQPWSVGRPVSNGCLRLPNSVLRRMFAATLTGTPVVIHP